MEWWREKYIVLLPYKLLLKICFKKIKKKKAHLKKKKKKNTIVELAWHVLKINISGQFCGKKPTVTFQPFRGLVEG